MYPIQTNKISVSIRKYPNFDSSEGCIMCLAPQSYFYCIKSSLMNTVKYQHEKGFYIEQKEIGFIGSKGAK